MAASSVDLHDVIRRYVSELRRAGIEPSQIILFGSHARGEADRWSDIDIVVVSEDLQRWPPLERLELLSRLTGAIDAPLEVLGYTPAEILHHAKDSILWAEIERDGRQMLAA